MLEAALLRHDRIPRDPLDRRLHGVAFEISDAHGVLVDDCDFTVAEEEDVARVLENRRNVRGNKKLAVTKTDDDRRTLSHGDDGIRLVRVDDRECEDAAKFADSRSYCLLERGVLPEVFLDEMGHDLRVGFSDEAVIGFAESLF